MTDAPDLSSVLRRVHAFESEAHGLLGRHEAAKSRVVILEQAYARITKLSLEQDDLLRQALRCAEHGLFRAAHVMAFAAFMDFVFEKFSQDALSALRRERPKWVGKDIHEMAEYYPDRQFLDVASLVGLATKNDVKQMVSLLDRRNECAHPSAYYPDLNMTLGYVSETLHMIEALRPRSVS